jgi:polysaccharide pyruvyl transferase WcaK-like protein
MNSTKRILLLHVYSGANKGDGLLVREAISLIKQTHDLAVIDIIAIHPDSFSGVEVNKVIPVFSRPPIWSIEFLRTLRRIKTYDIVFGVGGGYLRARTISESIKFALAHLPQLRAASKVGAIYLPQSVGPIPSLFRRTTLYWLSKLTFLGLRDDRSMELKIPSASRMNDMAILGAVEFGNRTAAIPTQLPVISTKTRLSKSANKRILELARNLGKFDSFIQSQVASNDDKPATMLLKPSKVMELDRIGENGPRVVVSVRLHGALMALHQGHFVIHLAYERKGFGAFSDLGLEKFVFPVNSFDVQQVENLVRELLENSSTREAYNLNIRSSLTKVVENNRDLKNVATLGVQNRVKHEE